MFLVYENYFWKGLNFLKARKTEIKIKSDHSDLYFNAHDQFLETKIN